MREFHLLSVGVLLIACASLGCSTNKLAPARVSGSISYKGMPIKAGTMQFCTSDGAAYNAQITSDGTYTATDLPEGELVVTVDLEGLNPDKKAHTGKDAEKRMKMKTQPPPPGVTSAPTPTQFYMKLPAKYANPKTSPLSVTLTKGRQVHNFDLTD